MPIIKSAKKQMRQNRKGRERNFPVRSLLKSTFKKALLLLKEGKADEAVKFMPFAFSVIDTASKKRIIHRKNADNKKSRLARGLNILQSGGRVEVSVPKPDPKKVKAEKKAEADVAE